MNRERDPAAEKEETLRAAGRELGSRLPAERGAAAVELLVLAHARTHPSYFTGVSPTWLAEQGERLFGLIDRPLSGFHVETRVEKFPGGAPRTILETVGPDQPFIVDSLLELVRVRGRRLLEAIHPIVSVERGPDGRVKTLGPPRKGDELVSLVRLEIEDALPEKERVSLDGEARAVLGEAQVIVRDFEPMMERLRALEASLEARARALPAGPERAAVTESGEFLSWLRRSNFVFLAYRAVRESPGASGELEPVPGSGLGLLREGTASGDAGPSPEIDAARPQTGDSPVVLVHKTSRESRVLRRARMDCIHVQEMDGGSPAGAEHRFLGLFTARAYNDLPSDIPILRKKLEDILARANVVPGSHDHKEIFSIFTSIPKAELFVTETDRIAEMIFGIMSASRRREVRVSFRPDFLERGVSVMVLLPRERFSPEGRVAIQEYLAGEFHGTLIDYRLALGEEPMARLHFYFAAPPGKLAEPSLDALEKRISEMTRTWADRLLEALGREHGKAGAALAERYARAFPPAYFTQKGPETAVADIHHIEKVLSGKVPVEVALAQGKSSTGKKVSILKIFRPDDPFALSALMPILTNLDLTVLDEQTFRITPLAGEPPRGRSREERPTREVFLHSFRVLTSRGELLPPGQAGRNIEDTILGAMARVIEDDALNALVTRAGIDAREVDVLRAYDSYLHQLGGPWTRRTTYAALRENPSVASLLVRFFQARFDPRPAAAARAQAEAKALEELHAELAKVSGIHEDQILRAFENLISATVRTSWYLPGAREKPRDAIAIKIRCASVARMPDPRPLFEIFVHGIGVEGVHLRSGKVARGGIRWSSRIDDYRMEILGLMKAQRTKNAVIVPVGAKGGFIVKAGATAKTEEILRSYQIFIGALLDVTDNVIEGKVVHPRGVVIHDEPDPYLVVAADRGTAGFSDVANEIATSRSFWLGDAFASGGSRGYNHKVEGITARGAWECVRRHFREMGRDPDRETFTVAGIGDMSGDVFGNGLIYSRNIRLLAAFNHVHIFIDPDPDPGPSFEERSRLFQLPRSAWTDYDPSRISAGGGVYMRDAKTIRLSPEARRALGIDAETLNGEELVAAVLRMPVDLLWNGGIGTYVKARTETHQEVGDPLNNAVRVDGADVRARIVAEGGNLGLTQLGRIEYARAGGRINTDFIDNSAGVDLSDHEVNLKIFLGSAPARKLIEETERDGILTSVKEEVCGQVLRDNYLQSLAISLDERSAPGLIEEHRFLIEELESARLLDREVEDVPTTEQLTRLRESKIGLTRPTLAVLLAYAKIDAYLRLLGTSLPDSPDLDGFLVAYFPDRIAGRFSDEIHRHALRREIAATSAVNAAINHMGITFLHRLSRRSGAELDAVLRAYLIASSLSGAPMFFAAADALYAGGRPDLPELYGTIARFRAAVEATTLEVLERRLLGKPAAEIAAAYGKKIEEALEQLGPADARAPAAGSAEAPFPDLEAAVSRAESVARILDIVGLAERAKADFARAHAAWEEASELLQIGRIEAEASRIARSTAEDIQTVDSLVEEARTRRAALARGILAMASSPKKKASALERPAVRKERARVVRLLETARTRQPLTPAGLFVLVQALGRIVREVSPRASRP